MKAVFTLIPSESRRLIGKAVAQMPEVKRAQEKGYVIVNGGTTNAYVAQELLGGDKPTPEKYTAGTNTHRLLCVTDADKRDPFPIIFYQGKRSDKKLPEALTDFHPETVVIKGANAIDATGKVAVIAAGFDGGTMGATLGTVVSQGLRYIVPVGLEKMIPDVEAACACTGAKTFDYTMGADFGMFLIPNADVVTEIEALKILADVEAKHVASGGVGESAGSVVLVIQGADENVKKAIEIMESIKGEPSLPGFKGTCEVCRYQCRFVGTKEEDLPEWLKS